MSDLGRELSKSAIINSWNKQKGRFHARTAPGIDDVSSNSFAANLDFEAEQLSVLMRAGKYQFARLRPFIIPKSNGKDRLINVPTIRDRFVQPIILNFLIEKYGEKWKLPNSFSSMGVDGDGVHETLTSASAKICTLIMWLRRTSQSISILSTEGC